MNLLIPSSSQGRSSEAVHPWEAPTNTQQPLNCIWSWPITQFWPQQPDPSWFMALSFFQLMVPRWLLASTFSARGGVQQCVCWCISPCFPPATVGTAAVSGHFLQGHAQIPSPEPDGAGVKGCSSTTGSSPEQLKPCQGSLGGSSEGQFALHWEMFYRASSFCAQQWKAGALSVTQVVWEAANACWGALEHTGTFQTHPD